MKLSAIIQSGLGPFEVLSPNSKVIIGDLTFDLSKDDPEVELVCITNDPNKYTYRIDKIGTYDFDSGVWIQEN